MKKSILSIVMTLMIFVSGYGQDEKLVETTFGVRGNCGMCKATIEKAALSVDGVNSAIWDKENKKIDVSFDQEKTTEDAIHQAIANSGYDTDKLACDEKAYDGLAGCCQYDHDMEMDQGEDGESDMQYQCPMKCEGEKTYNKVGSCPICKMDLKELKTNK